MTARGDQRAPFDAWAAYYDVTDRDRGPFIDFYGGLVSDDTSSLLELGCGTGTVAIALGETVLTGAGSPKQAGSRVVGLDESAAMLDVARRRDRRIEWIEGDIRNPPVEGPFDLVISPFNTLQFLLADEDLAQAFQAVRKLLTPGGAFAFDIYQPNREYLANPYRDRLARSVTHEGRRLEIREDIAYEAFTRVLQIDWRLVDATAADFPVLATMRYFMRQYTAADVERLLAASGLKIRQRYGELDRAPFGAESKKQVIVCG